MVERQEVEELLASCGAGEPGWYGRTDHQTVAALCRAWLTLDAGIPATVKAAGNDPETGQPRIYATTTRQALRDGPPLACRPVRIVPELPNG